MLKWKVFSIKEQHLFIYPMNLKHDPDEIILKKLRRLNIFWGN